MTKVEETTDHFSKMKAELRLWQTTDEKAQCDSFVLGVGQWSTTVIYSVLYLSPSDVKKTCEKRCCGRNLILSGLSFLVCAEKGDLEATVL